MNAKSTFRFSIDQSFINKLESLGSKIDETRMIVGEMASEEMTVSLSGIKVKGNIQFEGTHAGMIEFHVPLSVAVVREYLRLKANEILGLVKATESME